MHIRIIFYFILVFICISCERDVIKLRYNEDGAVIEQPHLWRTRTTTSVYVAGYVEDPICYDNSVLDGYEIEPGIAGLAMFDVKDGRKIWESNYPRKDEFFQIDGMYSIKGYLYGIEGDTLYNVNLKDGNYEYLKFISNKYVNQWLSGTDSLLFIQIADKYPINQYPVMALYAANTTTGKINFVVVPELGELPEPDLIRVNISIGGIDRVKPYKDNNSGDIKLICYCYKQYYLLDGSQISKSYLSLYNYTRKVWEYERIELGDYNFCLGYTSIIVDNKLYHTLTGGIVECRDISDGSIIWHLENDYQYSGTGFIIVGDLLITQDVNYEQLIAYNINTGSLQWRTPHVGGAGRFQELNGVIYFGSVADGELHAIDLATGNHIWRMRAPDHDRMLDEVFREHVVAIPGENGEKGKIIVSSNNYLYCYEAAR
jgi:hypothetical protein